MTYTPQTQWINSTQPMQPEGTDRPRRKQVRKLFKTHIDALLIKNPWQSATQIAIALECPSLNKKSPERTLTRMATRGAIARKFKNGHWLYAVASETV